MIAQRDTILVEIREAIKRVKEGVLPPGEITEASSLQEVGLDSLDLLEMRFEMERLWGIQMTDDQARAIRTVGNIVDFVAAAPGPQEGQG
jgi:acyl carrier protein